MLCLVGFKLKENKDFFLYKHSNTEMIKHGSTKNKTDLE